MSRLEPIWSPDDTRDTAAEAAKHPAERGVEIVGARPRTLRRLAVFAVLAAFVVGFAFAVATHAKADSCTAGPWFCPLPAMQRSVQHPTLTLQQPCDETNPACLPPFGLTLA